MRFVRIKNKIKKEIIFLCIRIKKNLEIGKGFKIKGPEYFDFDENIRIGNNSKLYCFDSYDSVKKEKYFPSIKVGKNAYIGDNFTVYSASPITIGKNVLIASNVLVTSLNHGMIVDETIPYIKQPLTVGEVKIEDGCWIGENVLIMPGVTIGNQCVIGAGSVVTKSIPARSIAVGNPAKIIKQWDESSNEWRKYCEN